MTITCYFYIYLYSNSIGFSYSLSLIQLQVPMTDRTVILRPALANEPLAFRVLITSWTFT